MKCFMHFQLIFLTSGLKLHDSDHPNLIGVDNEVGRGETPNLSLQKTLNTFARETSSQRIRILAQKSKEEYNAKLNGSSVEIESLKDLVMKIIADDDVQAALDHLTFFDSANFQNIVQHARSLKMLSQGLREEERHNAELQNFAHVVAKAGNGRFAKMGQELLTKYVGDWDEQTNWNDEQTSWGQTVAQWEQVPTYVHVLFAFVLIAMPPTTMLGVIDLILIILYCGDDPIIPEGMANKAVC